MHKLQVHKAHIREVEVKIHYGTIKIIDGLTWTGVICFFFK